MEALKNFFGFKSPYNVDFINKINEEFIKDMNQAMTVPETRAGYIVKILIDLHDVLKKIEDIVKKINRPLNIEREKLRKAKLTIYDINNDLEHFKNLLSKYEKNNDTWNIGQTKLLIYTTTNKQKNISEKIDMISQTIKNYNEKKNKIVSIKKNIDNKIKNVENINKKLKEIQKIERDIDDIYTKIIKSSPTSSGSRTVISHKTPTVNPTIVEQTGKQKDIASVADLIKKQAAIDAKNKADLEIKAEIEAIKKAADKAKADAKAEIEAMEKANKEAIEKAKKDLQKHLQEIQKTKEEAIKKANDEEAEIAAKKAKEKKEKAIAENKAELESMRNAIKQDLLKLKAEMEEIEKAKKEAIELAKAEADKQAQEEYNKRLKVINKAKKEIIKSSSTSKKRGNVKCPPGKIFNPKTGNCVKKDGKIGLALQLELKDQKFGLLSKK